MNKRIDIFVELGNHLATFAQRQDIIDEAIEANPWFTRGDILRSVEAIRLTMLQRHKLERWLAHYTPASTPQRVALIMAGNIPLVGFFDLMCVLLSGHKCYVKPSSKDRVLMRYVVDELRSISPDIAIYDYSADDSYDLAIATGGEDANRYFDEHFASTRRLLRGSRHSIAVLDGSETEVEIEALATDITAYSGLGCRSVSMIFYPKGLTPKLALRNASCKKLEQNIRSRKALLMMQGSQFDDYVGYIATRGTTFPKSLGEVTLHAYTTLSDVEIWLREHSEDVQCVVSHISSLNAHLPFGRIISFGSAQYPALDDYADGVDTMAFLTR